MRRWMKGVAAVEFGILLIPLVTLAFGVTEFGRAIYTYNTLLKSTRDAARYLTSQTPGDTSEHDIAKCMAVFGNRSCSGSALATGLTTAMIETCDRVVACNGVTTTLTTGTGTVNLVVVRITGYQFDPFVNFVMQQSLTFNNIAASMRGQL